MALHPVLKLALIASGAATVAGLGVWGILALREGATPPPPPLPGRLLCPREAGREPAPATSVGRGDFIVIQLQSGDKKFSESTWASVVAGAGGDVIVLLTGEQIAEGVRPLSTDKHGFRLGQPLVVPRDCIWEVFRPVKLTGQILCGPQLDELGEFLKEEIYPIEAGLTVEPGDRAQIIVASNEAQGTAWHERLLTRIVTISRSGQVLTARVEGIPTQTDKHGLSSGSVVRFNRDCIVGV